MLPSTHFPFVVSIAGVPLTELEARDIEEITVNSSLHMPNMFIIRMRDTYRWFNPVILPMQLAVDVLDIFFQWKHMLGVKARAERMAAGERTGQRPAFVKPKAL